MNTVLAAHVVAGAIALISGFVALYASKGDAVHRLGGMIFVYAILVMCGGGFVLAAVRAAAPEINIPAAILTGYLVLTAVATVRPALTLARWMAIAGAGVPLALAAACLTFGFQAVASGGTRDGMPALPFFLFGITAIIAAAGDFRVIRLGQPTGARRIARHLWRMCFALWIAALSFFIGQADVFPEPIRIRPLLALPATAVLITMLYWLWRVAIRRRLSGLMFPVIAIPARERP
jgi:uncharacterized membrane protein